MPDYSNPYKVCDPHKFAGRHSQKEAILKAIAESEEYGRAVLLVGASGSGKSSLIEWIKHECEGARSTPVIHIPLYESPGLIFDMLKRLVADLRSYKGAGWLETALKDTNVNKTLNTIAVVVEKASSFTGLPGAEIAAGALANLTGGGSLDLNDLAVQLKSVLEALSKKMAEEGAGKHKIVLMIDDVQFASDPELSLIKYLIGAFPRCMALVLCFRQEDKYAEVLNSLCATVSRDGHETLRIKGLESAEIKEFAIKRFDKELDERSAALLSEKIGDPLGLVNCFLLLKKKGLEPTYEEITNIIPEAVKKAEVVYKSLDEKWKKRTRVLCVLNPPMDVGLMACMVDGECERDALCMELEGSVPFVRVGDGQYDYVHSSLREYALSCLDSGSRKDYHARAVKCMESDML